MRKFILAGTVAGVALMLASGAQAALLSVVGGNSTNLIGAGNNVVGAPGNIGPAAGPILIGANLFTTQAGVTLTYFYTGAESDFSDTLVIPGGSFTELAPGGGVVDNAGVPGIQVVPSVFQAAAGLVDFRFDIDNPKLAPAVDDSIVNGANVPASDPGFALAYLDAAFNIVAGPTNRVGIFLDDGAQVDDNHDDWVGYVEAVPVPAAIPLFLSGLAGIGLISRRRARRA